MPKCFKCEKPIECACSNDDIWSMPADAVCFEGGSNFGSSIYDSMMDGIYVEIIVCDECLIAGKANLREFKIQKGKNTKVIVKE